MSYSSLLLWKCPNHCFSFLVSHSLLPIASVPSIVTPWKCSIPCYSFESVPFIVTPWKCPMHRYPLKVSCSSLPLDSVPPFDTPWKCPNHCYPSQCPIPRYSTHYPILCYLSKVPSFFITPLQSVPFLVILKAKKIKNRESSLWPRFFFATIFFQDFYLMETREGDLNWPDPWFLTFFFFFLICIMFIYLLFFQYLGPHWNYPWRHQKKTNWWNIQSEKISHFFNLIHIYGTCGTRWSVM